MEIFHWRHASSRVPFSRLSLSLYIYISPRNPSVSAPGPLFLAACQSISNVVASYFVPLDHLLLPRLFLSFALLKSLLVTLLPSPLPQGYRNYVVLGEDRSIWEQRVLYSGDFVGWGKKKKKFSGERITG